MQEKERDNNRVLLENAITYQNAGELDSAVNIYRKVINSDPVNEIANNNLGIIYVFKENYEKAIEHFSVLLQAYPGGVDTYFNLAEAYMLKEDYLSAVKILEKAHKLSPKDHQILINLAKCYKSIGDFESSIINWRQVLNYDENNTDILYEIAEVYYLMNNYDRSVEYSLKVLNRKNDDWRAKGLLADSYYNMKKTEDAVFLMKELINEYPDSIQLREKLAEYYLDSGNFSEALHQYETILSKEPGKIEYLEKYRELKKYIYNNSEKAFLSELESSYEEKLKLKAKRYFEKEDYKGLIHDFTKELINNSNNLFILKSIARGYCRISEYEDALKYYERYIENSSEDKEIIFEYASVLNKLKRYSESRKTLKILLDRGDINEENVLLQANNLKNIGLIEESITLLEKNINNLNSVAVYKRLGHYYLYINNFAAACNIWIKATKLFSEENEFNDLIARHSYNNGNFRQALRYIKRYIEQSPESFEAYEFMARVNLSLKKPKDAFQNWGEIIEKRPKNDKDILIKAKTLLYTERVDEAVKQLELLQNEMCDDNYFQFLKGLAFLMQEEYNECINNWENSLSNNKEFFEEEFFFIVRYFDKEKLNNLFKRWDKYEETFNTCRSSV